MPESEVFRDAEAMVNDFYQKKFALPEIEQYEGLQDLREGYRLGDFPEDIKTEKALQGQTQRPMFNKLKQERMDALPGLELDEQDDISVQPSLTQKLLGPLERAYKSATGTPIVPPKQDFPFPDIPSAKQPQQPKRTKEGRPILNNEDGSISTEETITIEDPFNNGKYVNIPTIYGGKRVSPDKAIEIFSKSGGVDPDTGIKLEPHETIDQAVQAAQARSQMLGQMYANPSQVGALPADPLPAITQQKVDESTGFLDSLLEKLPFGGHLQSPEAQLNRKDEAQLSDAPRKPEELGSFQKGVGRGILNTGAQFLAGGAAVAQGLGAEETAEGWMQSYEKLTEESEKFRGVQFGEAFESPGQFVSWAAGAIGEQTPVIASLLVSGGVGAVMGRVAAAGMMGRASKILTSDQARQVAKWGARAGQATAATAMTALESGGIYGEQREAGVTPNPGLALAGGAINGILETVVPFTLLRTLQAEKLAGPFMNDLLKKLGTMGILPRIMATVGGTAASEGLTEGLQEEVAIQARALVDEKYERLGQEAMDRRKEAAATGALVGGIFGGVGGAAIPSQEAQPGMPGQGQPQPRTGPTPLYNLGEPLPPVNLPQTVNNLGAFEGQQPQVQGPPIAVPLQEEEVIPESIMPAIPPQPPMAVQPEPVEPEPVLPVQEEPLPPMPAMESVQPQPESMTKPQEVAPIEEPIVKPIPEKLPKPQEVVPETPAIQEEPRPEQPAVEPIPPSVNRDLEQKPEVNGRPLADKREEARYQELLEDGRRNLSGDKLAEFESLIKKRAARDEEAEPLPSIEAQKPETEQISPPLTSVNDEPLPDVAQPKPAQKTKDRPIVPISQQSRKRLEGMDHSPAILLDGHESIPTVSGRKSSPFPVLDTGPDEKNKKANIAKKKADIWLFENAIEEARQREGEDSQAFHEFRDGLATSNIPPMLREYAKEYTFGDKDVNVKQSAVKPVPLPPIEKPTPETSQPVQVPIPSATAVEQIAKASETEQPVELVNPAQEPAQQSSSVQRDRLTWRPPPPNAAKIDMIESRGARENRNRNRREEITPFIKKGQKITWFQTSPPLPGKKKGKEERWWGKVLRDAKEGDTSVEVATLGHDGLGKAKYTPQIKQQHINADMYLLPDEEQAQQPSPLPNRDSVLPDVKAEAKPQAEPLPEVKAVAKQPEPIAHKDLEPWKEWIQKVKKGTKVEFQDPQGRTHRGTVKSRDTHFTTIVPDDGNGVHSIGTGNLDDRRKKGTFKILEEAPSTTAEQPDTLKPAAKEKADGQSTTKSADSRPEPTRDGTQEAPSEPKPKPASRAEDKGVVEPVSSERPGSSTNDDGPATGERGKPGHGEGVSEKPPVSEPTTQPDKGKPPAKDTAQTGDGERLTPEADQSAVEQEITPPQTAEPNPARAALLDYHIQEQDQLEEGGKKTKYKRNVDAIKLLKELEKEGRLATPDEQATLVRYTGWGGVAEAFRYSNDWSKEYNELEALLTQDEYRAAKASTQFAHYTSPGVIRGMWSAMEHMGFTKGRILEPGAGIGHFFGLMPKSMVKGSSRTAIEIDSLSGRFLKQLYQGSNVEITPFQDASLPDNFFDMAISNVPFSDAKPYGSTDKELNRLGFSLHDYYFAKSLKKIRTGGVVAFITSRYTMDKQSPVLRDYVAERADFLGAIRLPNNAFKGIAATEVTTDIIFLQKRPEGTKAGEAEWKSSIPTEMSKKDGGTDKANLNEYFVRNPHMMLGKMTLTGSMYRDAEPTLEPDGRDLFNAIQEASKKLPAKIIQAHVAPKATTQEGSLERLPAPGDVKESAFVVKDGNLYIKQGTDLVPQPNTPAAQIARVEGMMDVRDALRDVFRTQLEDQDDDSIVKARKVLNTAYDKFVKKHGFINTQANRLAFQTDPDFPALSSLEKWDRATKTATKEAIFSKRTIESGRTIEKVETAKEGLLASLNEHGVIDMPYMTVITGKPEAQIVDELGDLVYHNPEGSWEHKEEYLSGNVKRKLKAAEIAAKADARFERNVNALKAVIPADLMPTQISVSLGVGWIPVNDVQQFVKETLGIYNRPAMSYIEALGMWQVGEVQHGDHQAWSTPRRNVTQILEATLNLQTLVVKHSPKDGGGTDHVATVDAQAKQDKWKEAFKEWVWKDPARSVRLTKKYNDEFNHTALRQYDGAHLTLPGSNPGVVLRPHQKDAIWRILQTGNTLLGHQVGTGKTFTMIGAAMESRRIGLAKKPVMTVLKSTLEQFKNEFIRLYPAANLLVPTTQDFHKDNRKKLIAKIATGDWDAIIISHEQLSRIPVDKATEKAYLDEQIAILEDYILREQEEGNGPSTKSTKRNKTVKELEKAKARLEAKLKKRMDAVEDDGVTFEQSGIDMLLVDEADQFKNLYFPTRMTRVSGLSNSDSKRANDLYMKTRYLSKINNGRNVVFATGTPISNTIAEAFTMQRFLQQEALDAKGMEHFDAWARFYTTTRVDVELSPTGKLRQATKFSRFLNVPEMMQMFGSVLDIRFADDLNLDIPPMRTGAPINIVAEPSEALKEYMKTLVDRAEHLPDDPRIDNPLKITTDSRHAALDIRLRVKGVPDDPGGKVNLAVNEIAENYTKWDKHKGTQLVFLDLSTPKGKSDTETETEEATTEEEDIETEEESQARESIYADIRTKLIKTGIPSNQIAFIHDAKTDAQRINLYTRMNSGDLRVLMGTTNKLGTGVNVQARLVALHHIDAPWRPRDIEQREGRILRQSNLLYAEFKKAKKPFEVSIYRYATKAPSFDVRMWQTLEDKARGIHQVMRYDPTIREVEDVGLAILSAAEMKAIASGNPMIYEKVELDNAVMKLRALKRAHDNEIFAVRQRLAESLNGVSYHERMIGESKKIAEFLKANAPKKDEFTITIGKQTFTERADAWKALEGVVKDAIEKKEPVEDKAIGTFYGTPLLMGDSRMRMQDTTGTGKDLEYTPTASLAIQPFPDMFAIKTTTNKAGRGQLQSLESLIKGRQDMPAYHEKQLATAKTDVEILSKRVDEPFKDAEKLERSRKRLAEIDTILLKNEPIQVMPDDDPEPPGPKGKKPKKEEAEDEDFGAPDTTNEFEDDDAPSKENSVRRHAIPTEAALPLSSYRNTTALKDHADYADAKSGDIKAAVRLVQDLVDPETVKEAKARFKGATFVAPMAMERTGMNAIPQALAAHYAQAANGYVEADIIQTNRAYHTGASAMERILARPTFEGQVTAGKLYVLVDDVTTMGSTLAELSSYIQQEGGTVVGTVVLTNASRDANMQPSSQLIKKLNDRYGRDELQSILGINPAALTSVEAGYLIGFRDLDAIRTKAATTAKQRELRLSSKGVSQPSAVTNQEEEEEADDAEEFGFPDILGAKKGSKKYAGPNPRIQPAPITGSKPKPLRDILAKASKDLDQKIWRGKVPKNLAGVYIPKSKVVLFKYANNLDIAAHELAHALDRRFDLLGPPHMRNTYNFELSKFWQHGSVTKSGPRAKLAYRQAEGVAEWMRAYLVNPQATLQAAPGFTPFALSRLPQEIKDSLKEFGEEIRTFAGSAGLEQIKANIEQEGPLPPIRERIKEALKPSAPGFQIRWIDRMAARWTDDLAPVLRAFEYARKQSGDEKTPLLPKDDPRVMARLFMGMNSAVEDTIKFGVPIANKPADQRGTGGGFAWLMEPIPHDSLEELEQGKLDLSAYMIAERTLEKADEFGRDTHISGISGGLASDVSVAKRTIQELSQDPVKEAWLKEGAKRYRQWADANLRYLVDHGRMSDEQYQSIKDNNEYYVAMHRVVEVTPHEEIVVMMPRTSQGRHSKIGAAKQVVKSFKGSDLTIKDPYVTLLDVTAQSLREADRNHVLRSIIEALKLDPLQVASVGPDVDMGTVGRIAKEGEKHTIPIYRDGKKEIWQFHPEVYRALKGLVDGQVKLSRWFTGLPSLMRTSIVYAPTFAAKNPIRDAFHRAVLSESNSKPWDSLKRYDAMEISALKRYGGDQAGHYFTDENQYKRAMKAAMEEIAGRKGHTIMIAAHKLGRGYMELMQMSERQGRVAEYRRAFNHATTEGVDLGDGQKTVLDVYNAGLWASSQARGLMDYAISGEYMRWINQLVPFSNAAVQGIRVYAKAIKDRPNKILTRTMTWAVIPALIVYAMNAASDDLDEFRQISPWQRDLFYNFKIGPDRWVALPKSFEIGLVSSSVERLADYLNGNKNAFEGHVGQFFETMMPIDTAALAGPYSGVMQAVANFDFFRQRDIVPFYEKDLTLDRRKTWRASRLGQVLQEIFGIDARKIDFLAKQQFGYFGQYATKLSDAGRPERQGLGLSDTGFFRGSPASHSVDVDWLAKKAQETGAGSLKVYRAFRDNLDAYYDATSQEARDRQGHIIRREAKKLRREWERNPPKADFEEKRKDKKKAEMKKKDPVLDFFGVR